MITDQLILYRNINNNELFRDMVAVYEGCLSDESSSTRIRDLGFRCIYGLLDAAGSKGLYGNLWQAYITDLLVNDENSYSKACEITGNDSESLKLAAEMDFKVIDKILKFDLTILEEKYDVAGISCISHFDGNKGKSINYNSRIRDRICDMSAILSQVSNEIEFQEELSRFYKEYGVGRFGLHKAFRVEHTSNGAEIKPILNIKHVQLEDLVGYEIQKAKLIENTEAFLKGKPCNNCLLYGDAGTGKSTSIKAIMNRYYQDGLRIIELYNHQFKDLQSVISQVKSRNYKFIIYMDDLSFEDFETEYKYLKAVIEGGLEKKPDNVVIYATSNRRHLIKESFSDNRESKDELHAGDTKQEKISLSARFGVNIYYPSPEKKEFQNIVLELARRHGIDMDQDTLLLEANKWELSHYGKSGRTAQAFIDNLLGKE